MPIKTISEARDGMLKAQDDLIKSRERIYSEIEVRQKQIERLNHDIEMQNFGILCIDEVMKKLKEKEVYLDKALDQLERFLNENRANDVYAIGLIENAEAHIRKYIS